MNWARLARMAHWCFRHGRDAHLVFHPHLHLVCFGHIG